MIDETIQVQILDANAIQSNSIIFYDADRVSMEQIRAIKIPNRKVTNVRMVPITWGGVERSLLHLMDEEALNRAGWYRRGDAVGAKE